MYIHQYKKGRKIDAEKGGGEKIVDASGYIPAEVQINAMIQAGMRLDQSRRDLYDYEGEENDVVDMAEIPFDITRTPNFDMAEGHQLKMAAEMRLKEQAKKKKVEKVETPVEEKKE